MDKSFLDITGFADVFSRFWRQKNPAGLRRFAKKGVPFRKPASGFSCPKGCEGRYCMRSIPLAVLKHGFCLGHVFVYHNCMQSIPLAVLKLDKMRLGRVTRLDCMQSIPLAVLKQKERVLRLSPFVVPAFSMQYIQKKPRKPWMTPARLSVSR